MHANDRYMIWLVLVSLAWYLVRQCCHAAEHPPSALSGRKLSTGVAATMNFNHLFGAGEEGFPGTGESVKFSASKSAQGVLYPGVLAAWRNSALVAPASSNWWVRKPLANRPASPGSRSRINNRSMTRFSEVEIPPGLDAGEVIEQPTTPVASNATGLVELFRSAEQSRGIENFFWKYFVDSDVSASIADDDDDDDDAEDEDAGGLSKIVPNSLQGRKKKFHLKKKYKKFLIPLLLAYKIKFLALVPAIIGGLILLVKAAGLAGFFFALFTAVVSLKKY